VALPELTRRLGGRVPVALWVAVANPMMIIHMVGGGHNDLLVMGLLATGSLFALRGRHGRRASCWSRRDGGEGQRGRGAAVPGPGLGRAPERLADGPDHQGPPQRGIVVFAGTFGLITSRPG
jgi:hypothetical protein